MVDRLLMEHSFEEIEIRCPSISVDLSKQVTLKSLTVPSSMLASLPELPNLGALGLTDFQQESLALLENFPQVSRLSLEGDHYAISRVDASKFPALEHVEIHVTSSSPHDDPLSREEESPKFFSSLRASISATVSVNDTWTNQSFTDYICNYDSSFVTSLSLTVTSSQKWFRLPSCLSNWPTLQLIQCVGCQLPNFTTLPTTLATLNFMSSVGTWTQAEAGIVAADHPEANFFDWSWLPIFPNLNVVYFVSSNINGTLPNQYSHPKLGLLSVAGATTARSLQFVGTIAPDWFSRFPSMITLVLSLNKLTGTIPNTGLANVTAIYAANNQFTHWPPLVINTTSGFTAPTKLKFVDLSNNALVEIPSESDFQSMILQQLLIPGNPGLAGRTFPNIFVNTSVVRTPTTLVQEISASGCGFAGELPEIPSSQLSLYASSSMRLSFDNNAFSGTVPSSWSGLSLTLLNLSSNELSGTLASFDSSNGEITSQFIVSAVRLFLDGNPFSGVMFNISSMTTLSSLSARMSNVDFCATARLSASQEDLLFPQQNLIKCIMDDTNASDCRWAYPTVCSTVLTPKAPISSPTSPLSPFGCPLPSPGPTFICVGSVWTSLVPVTQVTITVPASSTTVINGNLTTSSIVINSASSFINVSGCVTGPDGTTPEITVVLTQEDLEKILKSGGSLSQNIITQLSACPAIPGSAVTIDTSAIKSCKTIKTDKVGTSSGLSATFTINSSKCNVWWIVLVSVLCVVAILAVIVIIVVFKVLQGRKERASRAQLEKARG